MISILVPSRGRPDNIRRLYKSLEDTTSSDWELLIRVDDDDKTRHLYPRYSQGWDHLRYVLGRRWLLSELWNDLYHWAEGDILCHGADDITFNTLSWDFIVRDAFPKDMIAFVHGDDLGGKGDRLGTHGFLSRRAVEVVGYFMPPYFASDYNDLWWNEVYESIGRRIFVPIVTEHHHFAFGKGELDQTHRDRLARHEFENVDAIWRDTAGNRLEDAARLKAAIR